MDIKIADGDWCTSTDICQTGSCCGYAIQTPFPIDGNLPLVKTMCQPSDSKQVQMFAAKLSTSPREAVMGSFSCGF